MSPVHVQRQPLEIPTYGLGAPERNPLFFSKRVYQGSRGSVYPVPFVDKVFDHAEPASYDAVEMRNAFVRLTLLPEIGGRIFQGQDLANHNYDFFYRQDVIKPALVGLAGPWISGGVEFNWPQHHRPGTYLPADVHLESCADGSEICWMSEHDPLDRLKGMHGICLRPGSSLVELKARLYNRTPFTQTFLWWANVAARVHDEYQSFFPPDVHYVADHAVRAQSSFPIAENDYYGIDYAARPGANDLRWYRNITVPTSYMVCETQFDFFGGYDFKAEGGFIHVADRHIAPGKKQWTWGNDRFGWAWDRELTDENGPYVELMAGVYTDNQPDFSFLAPYETKTFSQFWWPYQKLGPVQNATREAAVRLVVEPDGGLDLGVCTPAVVEGASVQLRNGDRLLVDTTLTLRPDAPWQERSLRFDGDDPQALELIVHDANGAVLCAYRPVDTRADRVRARATAEAPPSPAETESIEELVLTAEHLDQYRHPTRYPEPYLEEALRRDPGDARALIALGRRRLQQGSLGAAADGFAKAVARLTRQHPNPSSGEAHYFLGLCLRMLDQTDAAYAALSKATWTYAWRSAAHYELALLDCRAWRFASAVEHCEASLETNALHNKARVLQALALRHLGQSPDALLEAVLSQDPLDHWARYVSGDVEGFLAKSRNDAQTVLDLVYDFAEGGFYDEAIHLLDLHHAREVTAVAVPNPGESSQLTQYALAWLMDRREAGSGEEALASARAMPPDYLFPSRLHDQAVLQWALSQDGDDRNAAFGLGNLYFDRKRHVEAIEAWESAVESDPSFATVHRCLGIAYWNVRRDGDAARMAYMKAVDADPTDARILAEYDQLRAKLGDPAEERLAYLLDRMDLVLSRDDATVALAALYNETGAPERALKLLQERRFHPWEGGEGQVLRQYSSACLLLGQAALEADDGATALSCFEQALDTPENLGEAYHPLQAKADVSYWTGRALLMLERQDEACACFESAAAEAGDFQGMAVTEHSELSYFRGLALLALGRGAEAKALFADMQRFAASQMTATAEIDYFATSLPLLLVFEDDLDALQQDAATRLSALAGQGLEQAASLEAV